MTAFLITCVCVCVCFCLCVCVSKKVKDPVWIITDTQTVDPRFPPTVLSILPQDEILFNYSPESCITQHRS